MPYHNVATAGLSPVVESPRQDIKLTVDGSEWDLSNLMSPFAEIDDNNRCPVVVKRIRRVRFKLDEDGDGVCDDDNTTVTNNTSKASEDSVLRQIEDPALVEVHYPKEQDFPKCLDVDEIFSKLSANRMLSQGRLANPDLSSSSRPPGYYKGETDVGLSPRSTVTTPTPPSPVVSPTGNAALFVDLDDAENSTLSSHSSLGRPYYGLDSPPPRSRRGELQDRDGTRRYHQRQRHLRDDGSQSSRSSSRDDGSQSSRSSSRRLSRGDRHHHYHQHRSGGFYDRDHRYPPPPRRDRDQHYRQRHHHQQRSFQADREDFRRQNTRTYRREEAPYYYREDDRFYNQRQDEYDVRESPTRNHDPGEYDEQYFVDDYEQERHVQHVSRLRRRDNRPRSLSETRTMVEIVPGEFVPLRGSGETWQAIQTGNVTRTTCSCCSLDLMCISDADLVMCPGCRVISPVERGTGGGGLGLGMSVRDAQRELSLRR